MSFYRQIKNVINNNDYFYLRKKLLDRTENRRYNNNFKALKEDLNINNEPFENDLNQNLFLSNNIIAENNIGKFKQKILNRENILEQNYKNLNDYQNNIFNNKDNNIYNLKKNFKKIPLRNYQEENSLYKNGKRIYKSVSSGDVLKNNFYLSQLDNNQNNNNNSILDNTNYYINYTNRTLGKKKTDITDNNFLQIYTNKQNFVDYFNKNVEIQNENRKITEEKNNKKKNNMFASRLKEQEEIKMENNYFNSLATQNLLGEKKSKILYKNLLDEQVKNNISDKLMNENLTYDDIIQNKNYLLKKSSMTERKFLNKNKFVDVNPYKRRNYFLGKSSLKNDIILNPKIIFNNNKYIFPKKIAEN